MAICRYALRISAVLTLASLHPLNVAHAQTLADALDAPQLTWTTGGNQTWVGQTTVRHDGVDAARSGAIGNNQQSWLQTTVTGPGTLTFWWKVSSEAGYDFLEFQINGSTTRGPISGEVDWRLETIELGAGSHTLRWQYSKDFSDVAGQDLGWVDTVGFFPDSGPPVILSSPVSRAAEEGASVTFTVAARGALPLTYQWYRGQTLVTGAESSSLDLLNLSSADAGQYTVRVQNSLGSITSAPPAVLTVLPASLETTFNAATEGPVDAAAIQPDGKIVVGGSFISLNGQPRANLGRLNPDGSLDVSFNPGVSGRNGSVYTLAIQSDGKILVGGSFSTLGGQSRSSLGRLNPDGSVDPAFNPGLDTSFSTSVNSLVLLADGKVFIGGRFGTIGGQPRQNLARINADGTLDATFVRDIDGSVGCLALQSNGLLLVGGGFTLLIPDSDGDLIAYFNLVRLNLNASVDDTYYPDPDGFVDCIAVQADGHILVSGGFSSFNAGGQPRERIARLNGSGDLVPSFAPEVNGEIQSIALQTDGKILVAGNFTSLGGQPRGGIGRLNANGSIDTTFVTSADGPVGSVTIQGDGKVLVAGAFSALGGQPRDGLGRLHPTTPATQSLNHAGTTITWLRSGTSPEVGRTTFEHSADGNTWTVLGPGSRIAGGWQRTGASVPASNTIRARGYAIGGNFNSSGSIVEVTRGKPVIVTQPASRTNVFGTTTSFSVVSSVAEPLSYQWQKNGAPLSNQGNISGARTNILTLTTLSKADEGSFRVVITNSFGSVTSLVATLTVLDPAIVQQPQSANRDAGESVTFSVNAVGSPTLSYQWYHGASTVPVGTGPVLTVSDLTSADAGSYHVVVGNTVGTVASSNALLSVRTLVPLPEAIDAPQLTWATGGSAPWFGQAEVSQDGVDSAQSGAITDSQESWMETSVIGPGILSFWWRVSSETNFDFLEFYVDGALQPGRISGSVNWRKETIELGSGNHSLRWRYVKDNVISGNQDRAWVDAVTFHSAETSPPVITMQPAGQTVVEGEDVVLSVVVSGATPLFYQWFKGAAAVPAANSSSLSLPDVQLGDTAFYSVVVTNVFGSETSTPALLTVITPEAAGANGPVSALAFQPDGKLLVAGGFTTLGTQPRNYLGRLNPDGSLDDTFDPGADSDVFCLALQPDGKILIGGDFFNAGGSSRAGLARLNPDGSLDNSFNASVGGGPVYAVLVQPDGKVLVAGGFTSLAGQARSRLGRLNADGTLDAGFAPNADDDIYALALQPDGRIVAGGVFTTLTGQSRSFIGRVNANGTLDTTFNPGADGTVVSLAIQPDGKILATGFFASLAGASRDFIGRLNASGTLDTAFNPGADAPVFSLALQTDGKILLGGVFASLAGQPRSNLGRLNGDGTLDATFIRLLNAEAYCLAVRADGKVFAGGDFTRVDGQTRNRIARIENTGPATQSLQLAGTTATWMRGGTGPEVWRTIFETSVDGLTWSSLGEGTRVAGGWQRTGVTLPANTTLRTRGNVSGDQYGSAWFVEAYIYPNAPILLNAARNGASVELSWTPGPGLFQVQQTTSLNPPIIWQDLGAPVPANSLSVPTGSESTFWQIRRP